MKKKLFIGSSSESLDIANAIQENLDHYAEVTVWTQGVFSLSSSSLASLIAAANKTDFAVFVFAPDDVVKLRRAEMAVARDNVVFELGLFIGTLGPERVYFVVPRDTPNLHLPSDLLGITPAAFELNREDGNLTAALGAACNKIRNQMKTAMPEKETQARPAEVAPVIAMSDDESVEMIRAWLGRSIRAVLLKPQRHAEIDSELGLAPGSSARLMRKAVENGKGGWCVVVDNGQIVQLDLREGSGR
ncbi:TIR domain-containing protein [Corallococcus exiguus]|uniref:TIR domain-containing protein n=1 Tax=Corallococcus exiguus TaxID=83462 RepID=UPI0014722044|nr:nucleotide-binding protein [Corallococcus exiguus]NNB86707.1 nucleotide-binding protein [Corallococcus exiguus]